MRDIPKTIPTAFVSAREMAKAALKPLLIGSVYLGRTEKPYSQYPAFLETVQEMGLKLTSSFNNDKAAKAFNHIVAEQMQDDVRVRVAEGHFSSWLIDGSAAAKHRRDL